jgi:glucokinase
MSLAIGIEIGGTKLQAAIGLNDNRLIARSRTTVDQEAGAEGIRKAIRPLIDDALKQANCTLTDISGIGVGFGGPIDSKKGITLISHQIDGWDNFPLVEWFQDQFNCPCVIQNDASIAGYAEAILGAGKDYSRIFYITIGSGIGGGWIVDGKIDEGQGLGAAEIGHTWVCDPDIGDPEKLENLCSGWSIGRRAIEAIEEGEPSILNEMCKGNQESINAKMVYEAAERDDLLAKSILTETSNAMATAICNVIALLHPEIIVIGGGVSLMGDLFWSPLKECVAANVFTPYQHSYKIEQAALGEDVVLYGAILQGLEQK